MLGVAQISERRFRELLEYKLENLWTRARTLFRNCGPLLKPKVVKVLIHASKQAKLHAVLGLLELHYQNHLQYQPVDICGSVENSDGVNQTEVVFAWIYVKVLGLQPDFT